VTDPTAPRPEDLACREEVELITDYLEDALPPERRALLEAHLAICPGCSEYVDQMRTLAGGLGALREEALPDTLRSGLIASFRELHRRA
jgi:anti-sigma factor RsiW